MYYGLIEMKKTELEEWNKILNKADLFTIDRFKESVDAINKSMFSASGSMIMSSTPQDGMSIGGMMSIGSITTSSGTYKGKVGSIYGIPVVNTELIKKNKNSKDELDKWKEIFKKRQKKLDDSFPFTNPDKDYKRILQKMLDDLNGDTNASE